MTVKVEFKGNSVKFTFGDKAIIFTNKGKSSEHDDSIVEQFAIALLARGVYNRAEELNEKFGKL